MKKEVKITERGYAGHFCAASQCLFHRNTLVEYGNKRIVVSTVGNYRPNIRFSNDDHDSEIGVNRFYETMAFKAKKDGVYWEANVSEEIDFKSDWAIDKLELESDLAADKMHEKVVKEIVRFIVK